MSGWDAYIDSIRSNCAGCDLSSVAIYGQNGALWTADANINAVTPAEISTLVNAISTMETSICGTGFTLQGQKFAATKIDEIGDQKTLIGKAKSFDNNLGDKNSPMCIILTNTALIITIGASGCPAGLMMVGVGKVADHLIVSQY